MSVTIQYHQPDFVEAIIKSASTSIELLQTEDQKNSMVLVVERPNFDAINKNPKEAGTKYLLRTSLTMSKNVVASDTGTATLNESALTSPRAVHVSNLPQYENEARGEPYFAVVFETKPGTKEVSSKSRHYFPKAQLDFKKDMGACTATLHDQDDLGQHIAAFLLNDVAPA